MRVGDLVRVNDANFVGIIHIVLYIGERATLLYNSTTQQEEWFNLFIWKKCLEIVCK